MVVMGVDVYNVGGNVGEAGCGTGLMVVMVSLLGRCGALVGGQWPPSQQYYYRGDAAAGPNTTPPSELSLSTKICEVFTIPCPYAKRAPVYKNKDHNRWVAYAHLALA